MLLGPVLIAFLVALVVWLLLASPIWALVAFVLVLVVSGGGFYGSRRW